MNNSFSDIYKDKRVLITGHTGFKGSWLSLWLKHLGAQVLGVALEPEHVDCNFNVARLGEKIESVYLDIRNYQALQNKINEFRPEVIFHLAAQAIVGTSYEDPRTTFETNVVGTLNVLESIRHCDSVKAGVLITSDKCYRNVEQIWGYREYDTLGGDDPYSASKGCAELVINSYIKSYFNDQDGPIVASARAGNVVGGGDWTEKRLVPDCFRSIYSGAPIHIRNPDSTRPWQFVLEPLSGYLLLGQKLLEKAPGITEGWNFGPSVGENHTVLDVVNEIVKKWENVEVIVKKENAFHESTLLQLDCTKSHTRLGWLPVLNIGECIEFTSDWYSYLKDHPKTDMYGFCIDQILKYQKLAFDQNRVWIS